MVLGLQVDVVLTEDLYWSMHPAVSQHGLLFEGCEGWLYHAQDGLAWCVACLVWPDVQCMLK